MQRLLDPEGEVATARAAAAAGTSCASRRSRRARTQRSRRRAGDAPRWLQLYVLRTAQRTLDHLARGRGVRLLRGRAHGRHAVSRPPRARPAARLPDTRRPAASVRGRRTPKRVPRERTSRSRRRSRGATSSGSRERALPLVLEGDPHARGRGARGRARRGAVWSSRTTAAASSTASRPASTRCRRWPRRSRAACEVLRRRRHPPRHGRAEGARARRAGGVRRPRRSRAALAVDGEAGVARRALAPPRRDRARARRCSAARRRTRWHARHVEPFRPL